MILFDCINYFLHYKIKIKKNNAFNKIVHKYISFKN